MITFKYANKGQIESAYKQGLAQIEIMILQAHINTILHEKDSGECKLLIEKFFIVEREFEDYILANEIIT